MSNKEIEEVIKNLPAESPGPDNFTAEFPQTFRQDLTSVLFKHLQKIQPEGLLPNILRPASPNLDKNIPRKENKCHFL
jgi:hypothetical protein